MCRARFICLCAMEAVAVGMGLNPMQHHLSVSLFVPLTEQSPVLSYVQAGCAHARGRALQAR
jgi:hypothetical protein